MFLSKPNYKSSLPLRFNTTLQYVNKLSKSNNFPFWKRFHDLNTPFVLKCAAMFNFCMQPGLYADN